MKPVKVKPVEIRVARKLHECAITFPYDAFVTNDVIKRTVRNTHRVLMREITGTWGL